MKSNTTTASDRAAAAAWIARLHGEDRTPQVEVGLRRWLAASPAHRRAFELASDLWTEAERWPKREVPEFVGWRRASTVFSLPRALAAAALVGMLVTGAIFYWRAPQITTSVGEQRNLTLADGTRVALNTSTSIRVRYDRNTRRVEIEHGEALFEVAKAADRPFVATAGAQRVTALGTAFMVRRDNERVAVTLLEGKVVVSAAAHLTQNDTTDSERLTLAPGQRLSFVSSSPPKVDQPALAEVTAWQRGQVILDRTSLADAIAELNRYSPVQLDVEDPRALQIRVTGIFRAGDSENFAVAVADTYRLKVVQRDGKILLTGVPKKGRAAP